MSNTITKFKWFWAWQDDKEEAWLGEMARAGRHLQSLGLPGFYTFSTGEPRNDVYRLDFVVNQKDYQTYLQQFRDAGWEYVGRMGGWQYFRIEAKDGRVPQVTNEWKIAKYYRVLGALVVFFPIWIILLTRNSEQPTLGIYEVAKIIGLFFLVIFSIAILMISRRVQQLKRR
jgi:hypothetical protein